MFWEELNVNGFVEAVEKSCGVCVFPIGCLEKHGNHLPLGTDIYVAREVAARAAQLEDFMIFPSYPLGIVAEVKHKAGTIAISSQLQFQVLEAVFDEIARNGFKKILIANGHADHTETSQIMAIRPDLVHMDLVKKEESQSMGRANWYWQHGVFTGINWYASYPHQFAGDPTASTAEYGEEMLIYNAQNLAAVVKKLKEDNTLPDLFAEFYSFHDAPQL